MDNPDKNSQLFMYLVSSFEFAAMQGMGKLANPATGSVERNLDQAQFSIEILEMLKVKMKGNLNEQESKFLDSTCSQLKLNYVDEVSKKTPEPEQSTEPEKKES